MAEYCPCTPGAVMDSPGACHDVTRLREIPQEHPRVLLATGARVLDEMEAEAECTFQR